MSKLPRLSRAKTLLLTSLLVLVTLSGTLLWAQKGGSGKEEPNRAPKHETEIDYFATAAKINLVGQRFVLCNGVYQWGEITSYRIIYNLGDCGTINWP